MHTPHPSPNPLAGAAPLPLVFVAEGAYEDMLGGTAPSLPYRSSPDEGLRSTPQRPATPAVFED